MKIDAKFSYSVSEDLRMINIETNLLISGVDTESSIVITCYELGSDPTKMFVHFSREAFFGIVLSPTSSAGNIVEGKAVYMFGRKSGQEISGVFAADSIGYCGMWYGKTKVYQSEERNV
jgi:hypothetical protein